MNRFKSTALMIAVVALGLVASYLLVVSAGVWTIPSDDWGVGDQGHTVMVFMAVIAQSIAVLLGLVAFRIGEFVAGRRGRSRFTGAGAVASALIGFLAAANIIGESIQTVWPVSNDGLAIQVAGPFLAFGLVAVFYAIYASSSRSDRPRRALAGLGLGLLSAVVAGLALVALEGGIDFMVTPFWGYSDNAVGVYLTVGGIYTLFGVAILWIATFLAATATQVYLGWSVTGNLRKPARLSAAVVCALLVPLFLGMAIAIAMVNPEYGNAEPYVVIYVLGYSLLAFLSSVASALLFSRCQASSPGVGAAT